MNFAHDSHRETHQRVAEYLGELFEDPYLEPATGHFYVRYGSTVLEVGVEPYGPEETVIQVMAYCAQGVTRDEELLLGLLQLNHDLAVGGFSLVGEDIFFSHSIFGKSLQRSNLLGAIAAVATIADDYDDRIVAKYGGQTALERIQVTGGSRERRRRASGGSAGD